MRVHVSLLGEQSITEGPGGPIRTRSSRTVALIAYLVLHAGSPQTRQRIAGLFWPDSTDSQALTNLRRELHSLRRVVAAAPCLVVTAKDLCWLDTDDLRVDVITFDREHGAALAAMKDGDAETALRHADAALAEYTGDFLPGLYDDWLLDARAELQRRCVELCELICETRGRRGELPAALEAARRRIRLEPLKESGYRIAMELQAEMGDRAGAVSTYHRCASVLEAELGIAPDQATREALQRVLDQQRPARGLVQAGGRASESIAPRPGAGAGGLIGRDAEFGLLNEVWRTAVGRRGSLAVIRGPAGVGKTRLITEIAEAARQSGAVVASSQCFGTSGRLALAPVADWLRHDAVRAASATLDPLWRDEVERLAPSGTSPVSDSRSAGRRAARLRQPDPVDPAASSRAMADAWQRHRFFEGLARALHAVGRPTLLVLDNLQWCDQETLAFLTFFLGLSAEAPIFVAATLRNDGSDDEPAVASWMVRMRATGMLTELALRPLEIADTARLAATIRGRGGPDVDASLLQAATGGFPLHIVEAMRTPAHLGGSPLPAGDLALVLRSRLEQTSPVAREIAGLGAAVGRDFALDLLVEASDLEPDSVVEAIDELWRLRIVKENGDGYDFSHDLLRDAAYQQVSPPRRWLLHRRVAQGLELLHADDIGPVSAQLAEQYARGGRPQQAVEYYRRAADMATGIFALAEAIRLYTEALSIIRGQPPGRSSDHEELAVLEAMAAPLNARSGYSSPHLQAVLERSVTLAQSLGRRDSTVSALIGLWGSRFVQGRVADGDEIARRALTLVAPGSELSGSAHFAVGGSTVSLGRPGEALHYFEIAAKLTRGASLTIGTRPDVHSRAFAAHAHWLLGQDDLARTSCQDSLRMARSADHPYSLAVALAYAAITHQLRSDTAELAVTVAELSELCDRYGFSYYREWALILEGWRRAEEGETGAGLVRHGIDNLKAAGSFARMPYWLALLADVLAQTGQHEGARSTLDAAITTAQARADVWWLPEVLRMRAAYDDRKEAALERLRAAAELASRQGSLALLRRCERDLAGHEARLARIDGVDGVDGPGRTNAERRTRTLRERRPS
jgi:DNA-binding SARP family transcriptional activator